MYTNYSNIGAAVSVIAMSVGAYAITETRTPELMRIRTKPDLIVEARTTGVARMFFNTLGPCLVKTRTVDTSKASLVPRTELGRRLLALRRKALEHGMRLLSADEINAQVTNARGEQV